MSVATSYKSDTHHPPGNFPNVRAHTSILARLCFRARTNEPLSHCENWLRWQVESAPRLRVRQWRRCNCVGQTISRWGTSWALERRSIRHSPRTAIQYKAPIGARDGGLNDITPSRSGLVGLDVGGAEAGNLGHGTPHLPET